MAEWILIITLHTLNASGSIINYDVETIDGFQSSANCLEAAKKIGNRISGQTVNHRAAEGIDLDGRAGKVAVFTSCQEITK